jgi:signal transduction histidine kinase
MIVIGAMMMVIMAVLIWNTALQRAAKRLGRRLFREQAARLTAELKSKERSRLAVELHDSISQVLTGAALKIKAAQAMARTDLERSLANLSIAENSLRSSREELRYCLWDLRNNILDLPNFEEAVRQMLKPYIGETELAVRLPVQRRKISESTAHEILKIIRELAVNAVRHGAATKIKIAGSLDGSTLAFSVKDNGTGFDEATAPGPEQGHFGLLGIKDRLAYYNGTLSLHGSPSSGTKATVVMRIDAEQTEKSK